MPGAGRLTFSAGQVLTAAQVQDYLQDQAVMNFSGTAARATGIPTPSAGMVTHIGGGTVQVYNGTAWVALGGVPNANFSNAATGTYTDAGGTAWKYITYTASSTLNVTTAGFADVLVVGGAGGGGWSTAGGGGAGGRLFANVYLTVASHTITVGAGGSNGTSSNLRKGLNGSSSGLGAIYVGIGGGNGGGQNPESTGNNGGSGGGGGGYSNAASGAGGSGFAGQGNNGGNSSTASLAFGGGGGGGSSAVGGNGSGSSGGAGGAGTADSITGSSVTRAGGGGGGSASGTGGTGGAGGGGAGGANGVAGTSGTANTGGGGGGGGFNSSGGNGGSGVVIIRVAT